MHIDHTYFEELCCDLSALQIVLVHLHVHVPIIALMADILGYIKSRQIVLDALLMTFHGG